MEKKIFFLLLSKKRMKRLTPSRRRNSTRQRKRSVRKSTPRRRKQLGGDTLKEWHHSQLQRPDLRILVQNGYTIYVTPEDKDAKFKIKGIKEAVKILQKKGIQLPENLKVYLTISNPGDGRYQIMTEAIQRDNNEDKNVLAIIFLADQRVNPQKHALSACSYTVKYLSDCTVRPALCPCEPDGSHGVYGRRSFFNNTPKFLSDNTIKSVRLSDDEVVSKVVVTFIHEIGHILHEQHARDMFWDEANEKKTAQNFQRISMYANKWKEFVAEVFTALILDYKLDDDILNEYNDLGGPVVPQQHNDIGGPVVPQQQRERRLSSRIMSRLGRLRSRRRSSRVMSRRNSPQQEKKF
jgi:hypothetical protein